MLLSFTAGAHAPPHLARAAADMPGSGSRLSPINQRRLETFRRNRRGYWSLWLFLVLFVVTLFAELIANDRPILASYKGELLVPAVVDYPETKFGGFLAVTAYRDPFIAEEIAANGWMLWPPIRYSYRTVDDLLPGAAPSPPWWMMSEEERCLRYPLGAEDPGCHLGNRSSSMSHITNQAQDEHTGKGERRRQLPQFVLRQLMIERLSASTGSHQPGRERKLQHTA